MIRMFAHISFALLMLFSGRTAHAVPDDSGWVQVVEAAKGQDVYWHAWGGDRNVNRYIAWVAEQVRTAYGISLHHVKVGNISDSVSLLLAEKAAGRSEGGRIDLLWLNGENFAILKTSDLLFGPITDRLPHFSLVDTLNKPTTLTDFTVPTDGYESPWGMAQLVFFADRQYVHDPPGSIEELAAWAERHSGRFTYPAPPDFTGTTFLKQALMGLVRDTDVLYRPVTDENFEEVTGPLWRYLDGLQPHLWRSGRSFPPNYPALRQLMSDGEIDIALSFNPAEVASAVSQNLLPDSVQPISMEDGTIGNSHFVAIPKTASAKEGALVVADFLLSPQAQARKADPANWGDPTVLDLDRLNSTQAGYFANVPQLGDLNPTLSEPHPSWTLRLEEEWLRRYRR